MSRGPAIAHIYRNAHAPRQVTIRKHLERNRNDKDSKFRLILVESRIHRISRY